MAFVLLRVFLILLLVAANAFFAAAEFSLVSVRDTRIQQLIAAGRIGARTVQRLHQNFEQVVNGVQLGITVISLTLGWVGEPVLARLFEGMLSGIPHAGVYAHLVAIAIAFTLITALHVILGELVPKSLALQRAEQVALAVAGPMDVFLTVARPLIYVMSGAAGVVLQAFGTRNVRRGAVHSPDELKLIVSASAHSGQVSREEEDIVINALELKNVMVREVMVPRPDIISMPSDLTMDEALTRVVHEQHSRIPVYDPERGPEHIVGVLYAKDLMRWTRLRLPLGLRQSVAGRIARMRISQIMHDVLVVPETKVLLELLQEFKQRRRHLAVVVDEFGSTAGVITVEDVLEQLVGEIDDEFDVAPVATPVLDANAPLVLEGSEKLLDLENQFEWKLPRDEGYETLAGFVLSRLQKIPQAGEGFSFEGRRFSVDEMDGHRIAKVKVEPEAVAA